MNTLTKFLILLLLCPMLWACERGPDGDVLQRDLQAELDKDFEPGLFKVKSFKRKGSTPASTNEALGKHLLVYFNAKIEFLKKHNFGEWEGLNVATLAHILGAKEKGISGIRSEGNDAGDVLLVHGTSTYLHKGGAWRRWAYVSKKPKPPPKPTAFQEVSRGTEARVIVERMTALIDGAGVVDAKANHDIIQAELRNALRNIGFRINKRDGVYSLVTGQWGGEYSKFGNALQRLIVEPSVKISSYNSGGSVENCKLVDIGVADLAITQNNVAALAYSGKPPFTKALSNLRAIASIFPEPIHIVVPDKSAVHTVTDLRGKRVDIDQPASGSRIDALAVLQSAGLEKPDLAELRSDGLSQAIEAMKQGKLDAIITTRAAPTRQLQNLAESFPIRLLSISETVIQRMATENTTYIPIELPAKTYPGQRNPVRTLAATAVLVAHKHVPDERIKKFMEAVIRKRDAIGRETFQGYALSVSKATEGISIPMHSGAKAFFAVQDGKRP